MRELASREKLQVALFATASLLLAPVLYYSSTTPFALIDDYSSWNFARIFDSREQFLDWLHRNFLDPDADRFWPLREFYHAVSWKVFGPSPPLHHLSRWVLHFGSVLLFAAAFLRIRRHVGKTCRPLLLPLGLLTHLWLFFPNSPASRLAPAEVDTVFFLGLCNWAAALMLSEVEGASWTRSATWKYGLFCAGFLGLALSKEVNVAIVLWMLVSWFALFFRWGWTDRRRILGGAPLVLIAFGAIHRVYVAVTNTGVGYGHAMSLESLPAKLERILAGLFQIDTSPLITAGFAVLSAALLLVIAANAVNRRLNDEHVFVLFLLGQFASLFFVLGATWDVALRYWYPLVPVFTTLLAFSAGFVLEAARGRALGRAVGAALTGFVVFFIGCNYYNFAFQTVVQHSLRTSEERLISRIIDLVESGAHVRMREVEMDVEDYENLSLYFRHGGFFEYFHDRVLAVHDFKPETGKSYHVVTRKLWSGGDEVSTIVNRRNYPLLSHARQVAVVLQGKRPRLHLDAGAAPPGNQWGIVRMTSREPELLIRSDFDVYIDRDDNRLVVVKESCRERDIRARFVVEGVAADAPGFPERSRPPGFEDLAFDFDSRRLTFAACSGMRRGGNRLISTGTDATTTTGFPRVITITPVVGKPVRTALPYRVDPVAQASREAWRWERDDGAGGWVDVSRSGRPTWRYVPGAADLGRRLRARSYYTGRGGNRIEVITGPSRPVAPLPGGPCAAWCELPDHEIVRIRIGQYAGGGGGGCPGKVRLASTSEPADADRNA